MTPLTFRQRWSVRVKVEKRDLWLGVFWDRTYAKDPRDPARRQSTNAVVTYICVVPCLPIVITRVRGEASPWLSSK